MYKKGKQPFDLDRIMRKYTGMTTDKVRGHNWSSVTTGQKPITATLRPLLVTIAAVASFNS